MFSLLASLLNGVSSTISKNSSIECYHLFLDEPECPKSLIEK